MNTLNKNDMCTDNQEDINEKHKCFDWDVMPDDAPIPYEPDVLDSQKWSCISLL